MALQKNTININFGKGLDTKTDPWQVQPGKFLSLQNSIFTKGGMLQKRNGYKNLPEIKNLPSFVTTYAGNLTAVGTNLQVLSEDTGTWNNRGKIQPVDVSVVQMVRSSININAVDSSIAPNGLACSVYTDTNSNAYYQISDSATGQIIVSQTQLPIGSTFPRVFSVGNFFYVTFLIDISGTVHLRNMSVPIFNPSVPMPTTDISTQVKSTSAGYDGVSYGGFLYISWNSNDAGGSIRSTFIDSQQNQANTFVNNGFTADLMSLTIYDNNGVGILWVSFWDSSDMNGHTMSFTVSGQLLQSLPPTQIITAIPIAAMTSVSINGILTLFYETVNTYSYSSVRTDFVSSITCTSVGAVGSPSIILRGVGISGKAFFLKSTSTIYLMVAYGGSFQPVNFLIDSIGNVIAKLAYENSIGYMTGQVVPTANVSGTAVTYGYLYKFLAVPVNAAQGVSTPNAIYGQAGINLGSFSINKVTMIAQEIAGAIHLTGGFVWFYDGNKPVEHGFQVFPEDVGATTSGAGGLITAQKYFYYAVYAWFDAAGNVHRSAPSIPYEVTTTGATSTNTINVPTLRQTYKTTPNIVRIEIYRWSTAQQVPYLITSESNPILNDTTIDSISYTDTASDAAIIGNEILYTNGGTVDDIASPPACVSTLFKSRMFIVDSEDRNLLWFSKVVIESTPVEFSNLLTLYVAPTISAQGNTGPVSALSAMDDKLIIFKKNAIYYITGQGPDNTGANSDYGDPIFITSSIGCINPQSIVLVPQGLMFQSDKGIWILGRDLSTNYIGAPVEQFNSSIVLASITVPGTNQVRFTLNNGITLMYDYFYEQWGTFVNIPAISSTIYKGLHTFLNSLGKVFEENPGSYLDGSTPVLMAFTTSWLNMTGLQGYQRAYEFYLIGQYLSPHKLQIQVAYDYNPYFNQQSIINPDNFSGVYGADSPYGNQSPYGGPSQVEQWRVFFNRQTCESFQISVNELYDPSLNFPAGAGLTLSGLDIVFGSRKGYPRLPAARQIG